MSTTTSSPEWATVPETAELLGISTKTVRRMISRGELDARRFGPRLIRINISDLESAGTPMQYGSDAGSARLGVITAVAAVVVIIGLALTGCASTEATDAAPASRVLDVRELLEAEGADGMQISDAEIELTADVACGALRGGENSYEALQTTRAATHIDGQTGLALYAASITVYCPEEVDR